jgi:antirestriction protein ArdC
MADFTPHPAIDAFVEKLGATILYVEDDMAFYWPFLDLIRVPPRGSCDTPYFYATLLHEHAHWTGHMSRLDRSFGCTEKEFVYAREELTAIVATLHLCAYFGLPHLSWADQIGYADRFIPTVQGDAAAIRYALCEGRRAALYLHESQDNGPPVPEAVLFQSVDALAVARFSAMLPPKELAPAPAARSPLAPLIERFRTVPRVQYA